MSQSTATQLIERILDTCLNFLFRLVVNNDTLAIVKPFAVVVVATLLCCETALSYPGDYTPFEPGEEPPQFQIERCETVASICTGPVRG